MGRERTVMKVSFNSVLSATDLIRAESRIKSKSDETSVFWDFDVMAVAAAIEAAETTRT
jgi:hypothetical protein